MGEWRPAEGMAIDPAVLAVLGSDDPVVETQGHNGAAAQGQVGRKTTRTPHEKGRAGRSVNVSFPSGAWVEAVKELAVRWGCRPADVQVLAVSMLMDVVHRGGMQRPEGEVAFWMRAGGEWELPWEPD